MTWQDDAPCRGLTHLFFAPLGESAVTRRTRVAKAQAICRTCPYQRECAEASTDEVGGVWAGEDLDEPMLERRRISKAAHTERHRSDGRFTTKPINHGGPGGYTKCRRRPEGACDACKREHASDMAWRRAQGVEAGRIRRWSRQWLRRRQAAAVAESWALRNEMQTEVAA